MEDNQNPGDPDRSEGSASPPGGTRGRLLVFFSSWKEEFKTYPASIGFLNREKVVCFRNCAFASLLHLPVFVNWLAFHLEESCIRSMQGKDCIICHMAHLSEAYWKSSKLTKDISTRVIRVWNICRATFWRRYDANKQQDNPEFLGGLINYLGNGRNGSPNSSDIVTNQEIENETYVRHIFSSITTNRDICETCGNIEYRGSDIEVVIGANILQPTDGVSPTIEQCIDSYMEGGELTGLHCKICKKESTWRRRVVIRDAPEVLIVQLFRYKICERGKVQRNADNVSFQENLDMTKHQYGYLDNKDGEALHYKLSSVVLHSGESVHAGHYVNYVKNPEGEWYHLDDEAVTRSSLQGALNSHVRNYAPYVLVYTRQPLIDGTTFNLPDPKSSCHMDEGPIMDQEETHGASVPGETGEPEYNGSSEGNHTPVDDDSEGVFELGGSSVNQNNSLSTSIHFARDATNAEEDEQWGVEKRWEGQQAKVKITITMDDVVLTGYLRGVFKKSRRTTALSAAAKPQGVTKSKGPSKPTPKEKTPPAE